MQNRNIKRVAKEKLSRNNIQNLTLPVAISKSLQVIRSRSEIYVMQKSVLGQVQDKSFLRIYFRITIWLNFT